MRSKYNMILRSSVMNSKKLIKTDDKHNAWGKHPMTLRSQSTQISKNLAEADDGQQRMSDVAVNDGKVNRRFPKTKSVPIRISQEIRSTKKRQIKEEDVTKRVKKPKVKTEPTEDTQVENPDTKNSQLPVGSIQVVPEFETTERFGIKDEDPVKEENKIKEEYDEIKRLQKLYVKIKPSEDAEVKNTGNKNNQLPVESMQAEHGIKPEFESVEQFGTKEKGSVKEENEEVKRLQELKLKIEHTEGTKVENPDIKNRRFPMGSVQMERDITPEFETTVKIGIKAEDSVKEENKVEEEDYIRNEDEMKHLQELKVMDFKETVAEESNDRNGQLPLIEN